MTQERRLTPEVVNLIQRFQLERGGHEGFYVSESKDPKDLLDHDNRVCVMEMVGVLQGRGVTTSVPCVSQRITSTLIKLNDSMPEGTQEALIEVIPYILHTAPVKATRAQYAEYIQLEYKRKVLLGEINQFYTRNRTLTFLAEPGNQHWPIIISTIKEAADLRRWEEVK